MAAAQNDPVTMMTENPCVFIDAVRDLQNVHHRDDVPDVQVDALSISYEVRFPCCKNLRRSSDNATALLFHVVIIHHFRKGATDRTFHSLTHLPGGVSDEPRQLDGLSRVP